jgi:hypothetical protein
MRDWRVNFLRKTLMELADAAELVLTDDPDDPRLRLKDDREALSRAVDAARTALGETIKEC